MTLFLFYEPLLHFHGILSYLFALKNITPSKIMLKIIIIFEKNQDIMEVQRVIHPIGQGAFYTESIHIDGSVCNIVYDCGSGSGKNAPALLKREISSFYNENDVIDILFISHFDNDHINGISELRKKVSRIKNIVVPLVDCDDIWYYWVENPDFLPFYNSLNTIADNVFRVKPQTDGEEPRTIDLFELRDYRGDDRDVESGSKFILSHNVDWCYITFNYDRKQRLTDLKAYLIAHGLSEAVFENGWGVISQHLDTIKEAYTKIVKDGANKSSLIVYSGGLSDSYDMCSYNRAYMRKWLEREGCLYFGDNDLNQLNLLPDLQRRLGQLVDRVGTIQVPHHGALKNFNYSIFGAFRYCELYFISFGNTNSYGHPSLRVVIDIIRNNKTLAEITQSRDSAYFQFFWRR